MHKTLHRDIYWLGRQWAVTRFGVQAVDHKLNRKFDVEVSRIGDEGLAEAMLSEDWFDIEDFANALKVARQRLQETPQIFRLSFDSEK